MFTYCLNNAVIFGDSEGTDAIIDIDHDAAAKAGHIGILVQGEEDNWIHFYWGPYGDFGMYYCATLSCVYPETWAVLYEGALTLDAINESEQYWGEYDDMIYIEGDFSKSAESATKASIWTKGFYHLQFNNCSQVSLGILSESDTPYSTVLRIAAKGYVPRGAFKSLRARINELESEQFNTKT